MASNKLIIKWKGREAVDRRFKAVPQAVRRGALLGLRAVGLLIQNEARKSILRGPKSGRIYQKYNPKRKHQASAPGQPPASDTGTLVRSIIVEVVETSLTVIVSAGTKYAKMLEYGTKKMLARPFLIPALEAVKEKAKAIVTKYIRAELRK